MARLTLSGASKGRTSTYGPVGAAIHQGLINAIQSGMSAQAAQLARLLYRYCDLFEHF